MRADCNQRVYQPLVPDQRTESSKLLYNDTELYLSVEHEREKHAKRRIVVKIKNKKAGIQVTEFATSVPFFTVIAGAYHRHMVLVG